MYLKIDRELGRCERVMRQRITPHIHRPVIHCEVRAFDNPGEPEPSDAFLAKVRENEVEFHDFPLPQEWGTTWGTTWFELTGVIPQDALHGKFDLELMVDLGWHPDLVGMHIEGLVYRPDGSAIKAVHPRNNWVPLVRGGQIDDAIASDGSFTLYLEAASNPIILGVPSFAKTELGAAATGKRDQSYIFRSVDVCVYDRQLQALWADLDVVSQLVTELPDSSQWRWKLAKALQRSMNIYNERDLSTVPAARKALADVLATPGEAVRLRHTAVGHAHIDSAWLWPVRETKRKVARTVANTLALMDQDPEYVYAMSSAQQYVWLEQEHPDLFERVKARVAEGRFIPVGGMWVESDGMLPSGESLIRQISYGQRYFRDRFGGAPKGIWLPDSFGYNGQFPQIARRSGYEWFLTQKISWSDTTRFPHHSFMWEGIDGSRIFTHFPPSDNYGSQVTAKELKYSESNFKDKDLSDKAIMLYGYGDGGGGATREMMERVHHFENLEGIASTHMGSPETFFAETRREMEREAGDEFPVWKGELYLELHRATLTSQQDMKRGCRGEESLLRVAEYLGTMAMLIVPGYVYPKQELDRIWTTLLLNQFHDILPGSAIAWVHRVAREDYARDSARLREIINEAAGALRGVAPNAPVIADAVIPSFSSSGPDWRPVPAVARGEAVAVENESDGSVTLKNEDLTVRIAQDGTVVSAFDRRSGRELIPVGTAMGRYEVLRDEPVMWDAWDIERDALMCAEPVTDSHIIDTGTDADGVARVTVEAHYGDTVFETVIALGPGSNQLDFAAHVDWQTKERFLKVDMPLAIVADRAQYECQYGMISRPVVKNSPGDEAQFENCSHRFVRIADGAYGASVVNATTYGSDAYPLNGDKLGATGTMLRLSLLEGPEYPDPDEDMGEHDFHWALALGSTPADTVAAAARIVAPSIENMPVVAVPVNLETLDGSLAIDWIKPADDGSGDVIIRIYEFAGSIASAVLHAGKSLEGATVRETDALEGDELPEGEPKALRDAGPLEGAQLRFGPFQFATLRVHRS